MSKKAGLDKTACVFIRAAPSFQHQKLVIHTSPGLATNSIFIFRFLFVKILFCLEGKFMTLFKSFFELTRHPSRALNSPPALLSELQRNKDTVRCVALDAEVKGPRQEQLTRLVCAFVENALFYPIP